VSSTTQNKERRDLEMNTTTFHASSGPLFLRLSLSVAACAGAMALAACAPPPVVEERAATSSALDRRFDPNYPASTQSDDWSCSVYTTTWMLRATANDETWSSVSNRMLSTGRVSQAQGLSDASGAGLAQTLREMATGSPDVGSTPSASFDEVAAKAGEMAVGIGGRAWNHWSAVRGYDAKRDVLLLANSAPGYRGVSQTLDRGQFRSLGGMSMVWMDYGQAPPPKPFEPSAKPGSDPFPALHIRAAIGDSSYITQCNVEGDSERVWQTDGTGPDPDTRWAKGLYPQKPWQSCGEGAGELGVRPLVLRGLGAGDLGGAWIVQCSGYGDRAQHVFQVNGEVDGHPAATFLYDEPNADCD